MENKNHYSNEVMFSALSGLLFFSPFVKINLKKNPQERTPETQLFVASRCKVGNGLWCILLLFAFCYGIGEWSQLSFFFSLAELFSYLMVVVLVLAFPLLISGMSFQLSKLQQSPAQKKQMLTSFLPLWSSYQRFRLQNFEKPYRWLKEAQVWLFGIWFLLLLFSSPMPWMVLGALLLLRLGLLALGWDVLSQEQKLWIHRRFRVLPWESFSLVLVQIQLLWAKLLKKPFTPQERFLAYQASYHSKKTGKVQLLSLLIRVPILVLLAWSWWNAELWRKMIPGVWALIWSIFIISRKTSVPKLPIIAELTAKIQL